MKKLVMVLNFLSAIYFFLLANFYFWGSLLALGMGVFVGPNLPYSSISLAINMLLAPFLVYGSIILFRKEKSKYIYSLFLIIFIIFETQIYRFFFVTGNKFEIADLTNLIFFGIPTSIIYLTNKLDR